MRRNYRFLLKWLVIAAIAVIVFNIICANLSQSILSGSISSLSQIISADSMASYEDSLISWAQNGQSIKQKTSRAEERYRDDLQLIGAQIIFRHGARTPLHLLPNLEEVTYTREQIESYAPSVWDVKIIRKVEGRIVNDKEVLSAYDIGRDAQTKLKSVDGVNAFTGQLTSVGEKQLYQLGQRIRKELIDIDGKTIVPQVYNPKLVYCRSTFMNRTIRSARSFLSGFFASTEGTQMVRANGPFEIEVHNFTEEDMFPNVQIYPILRKCSTYSQLYESLDDHHEMKRARNKFLERINSTNYNDGVTELYDDIVSRLAHGFPVPDDLLDLSKDFPVMSARELTIRGTSIGFMPFVRACSGQLIARIIRNFQFILKNYFREMEDRTKNEYQKFFVYSGHDSTLIPLAIALEIFDMYWPPYASELLLKLLVSKKHPEQAFIFVSYRGKPQILPNCTDYYCPFSTFVENLENRHEKIKYLDEI